MTAVARLVLDTNACLDLFVFGDPGAATLSALLAAGRAQALYDAHCRAEWQRVLRYPALALDATAIASAEVRHAALVRHWQGPDQPLDTIRLPRCRDPDDQPFVELAARCGARALVTRDAKLLRLSRRTLTIAGFVVVPPAQVATLFENPVAAAPAPR